MNKQNYIEALALLLDLGSTERRDLDKLKIATIEAMYNSYIANAKNSSDKLHEMRHTTHVNTGLPPVDTKVLVKYNNVWVETVRKTWITSKDGDVTFQNQQLGTITLRRSNIEWIYP